MKKDLLKGNMTIKYIEYIHKNTGTNCKSNAYSDSSVLIHS